jgi:hypothetical protein
VVVNQVNKDWDCTKEMMDAYCAEVRKLERHFHGLEFHYVPREDNVAADALSKLGSHRSEVPSGIFVQELHTPSIKEQTEEQMTSTLKDRQVMVIDPEEDWMKPINDYILHQIEPTDQAETDWIV